MRQRLYQMFDTVAGTTTGPIIPFNRDTAAIRMFQDVAAAPQSDLHQHPTDYVLLLVGEQDTETGTITPTTPTTIYGGDLYLEQLEAQRKGTADSAPAANGNGAADASPAVSQPHLTEAALQEEFNKRVLELRQRMLGAAPHRPAVPREQPDRFRQGTRSEDESKA